VFKSIIIVNSHLSDGTSTSMKVARAFPHVHYLSPTLQANLHNDAFQYVEVKVLLIYCNQPTIPHVNM